MGNFTIRPDTYKPVQQDWVCLLTMMQQSVLFAAIRAPDGLHKNHPTKVLMRWYRRCILLSAFDRTALTDPFVPGGGSFTGPFTAEHVEAFYLLDDLPKYIHNWWDHEAFVEQKWKVFNGIRKVYLNHVDEMPHHFQLHFMHAAQIVGYKHPISHIRAWWREFYEMIVNDAHLFPESEEQMDARLGDTEAGWRAREVVTAV